VLAAVGTGSACWPPTREHWPGSSSGRPALLSVRFAPIRSWSVSRERSLPSPHHLRRPRPARRRERSECSGLHRLHIPVLSELPVIGPALFGQTLLGSPVCARHRRPGTALLGPHHGRIRVDPSGNATSAGWTGLREPRPTLVCYRRRAQAALPVPAGAVRGAVVQREHDRAWLSGRRRGDRRALEILGILWAALFFGSLAPCSSHCPRWRGTFRTRAGDAAVCDRPGRDQRLRRRRKAPFRLTVPYVAGSDPPLTERLFTIPCAHAFRHHHVDRPSDDLRRRRAAHADLAAGTAGNPAPPVLHWPRAARCYRGRHGHAAAARFGEDVVRQPFNRDMSGSPDARSTILLMSADTGECAVGARRSSHHRGCAPSAASAVATRILPGPVAAPPPDRRGTLAGSHTQCHHPIRPSERFRRSQSS